MSQANTTLGRILLLRSEGDEVEPLIEWLRQRGQLQVASTAEAAAELMKRESFDCFLTASTTGPTTDRPAGTVRLATVLETIGQAVAILDPHGDITWSNKLFTHLPEDVVERVRRHCAESYDPPGPAAPAQRPRTLSLIADSDRYYEVAMTPIAAERQGDTRLIVAVSDVTRARRLQQKVDAIDNAGRELVRVDTEQLGRLDFRQRLELLERKIIRYTRELLHFDNFAIRLLDKNTNKLELVLCSGLPPEAQQIDIYASTENSGISGYVAATGRSYICPDVTNDSRYLIGIDNAHSSLTVPLCLHDHVIGILNIESHEPAAFTEEDRQFAEIFGRYVAVALHILDLLVVERSTTTGRLADNVSAEVAGPLGEILADASTLMEDYIGHDDLRRRLQAITDNVVRIKESIKQVTRPTTGILGSTQAPPQTDPCLCGKVVLVIDDEETIRLAVRDVLTKGGCEVETAREGDEALALIRHRHYDLVLTDIRMPGKSGYQIFAAVKDHRPDCPVIFMTGFGYDPNHSIVRARPEGLASVLYKPFKVDQLLDDVRAAVSAAPDTPAS